MADKNKSDSNAVRAGRWLARLIGRRNVAKLRDSAELLKSEYAAGKQDAAEPPPRKVPYRLVDEPASENDGAEKPSVEG